MINKNKQEKLLNCLKLAFPTFAIFFSVQSLPVYATNNVYLEKNTSADTLEDFNTLNNDTSITIKNNNTEAVTVTEIKNFEMPSNVKKLFSFDDYKNIGIITSVPENTDNCPIFTEPNVSSQQIGKINLNGVCTIDTDDGEWYKITSGSVTGYVMKSYVTNNMDTIYKNYEILDEIARANTSVSFYENQFDTVTPLATYEVGTEFKVIEKYEKWVKVSNNENIEGFIAINDITLLPKLAQAEVVTEKQANYTTETTENNETRIVVAAGSVDSQYTFENGGGVAPGSASPLRQEIVNYACQFIGNPYVWGGTNPYTGADCSGFVQYVYAHFGYSIPRTTYAQWSWALENGKVVDPSEAQAGDLVLYDGHVTMLTGNGNEIVHASNSAPYPEGGIKITADYNYQPILGIVRIL